MQRKDTIWDALVIVFALTTICLLVSAFKEPVQYEVGLAFLSFCLTLYCIDMQQKQ